MQRFKGLFWFVFIVTEKYHLTYKFVKTECKLVRSILGVHCFKEVSSFPLFIAGILSKLI